jgi:signal transduction histidine kinase
MQSAEQVLLFIELLIYVVLMLQVLLNRQAEEVEEYLVVYLGLSVVPTLLLLTKMTIPLVSLPSTEVIASWARILPVLGFGALTQAFIRQPRWALGWLSGGLALFGILVALQLGGLPLPPVVVEAYYVVLWVAALGGTILSVLLAYRRQTSPLHRNRYHYWVVILTLLVAAEGVSLAPGFLADVVARGLGWMAAGLATYVILQVHPPELRTLVRQAFRFLALTMVLGLIFFGVLMTMQTLQWPTLTPRESLLLTGVIAIAMAVFLPGLLNLSGGALNYLIFGANYDEQEVVRHYGQSVSNILDIDRLAALAFDVINQVFSIERGALLLVQFTGGGRYTILPVRGVGTVPTQLVEVETCGTLLNRFRQGTPLTQYDIDVLPTFRHLPDEEREWLSDIQMELYVPIRSQDEVIGLLALGPKRSGEPFRHGDTNLLCTLADQTVAALKNAQMVQELRRLNLDIGQLNIELETMNRTKTDFISITSHELRTPLSQVNGYSQMLAEELQPKSSLRVFVDGLLKGTARLTEIVDMMLDVTRLDVGTVVLHQTPVEINDVMQRAAGEWTSALEERGHSFTIEGFETLPTLEGDKERLQQAFSQLINNAIKYTPDGGCIEVVGAIHGESNGLFMEVTVSDNGIGIDPDEQHKIFDKFYRTGDLMKHSTGKTKFKGAGPGLGLSLVKGIVDAHSGRIWVESPGHDEDACPGSSFHVLLPLHPPDPEYNPGKAETAIHRKDAIAIMQTSAD